MSTFVAKTDDEVATDLAKEEQPQQQQDHTDPITEEGKSSATAVGVSSSSSIVATQSKTRWVIMGIVIVLAILAIATAIPIRLRDNDDSDDDPNLVDGVVANGNGQDDAGNDAILPPPTHAPSQLRGTSAGEEPTGIESGSPPTTATATTEFYKLNEEEFETFLNDPNFFDKEFYMVNIFSYREYAIYEDGRETNLTGYEANQLYSTVAFQHIFRIGGEVVFSADIEWNMGRETPYKHVAIVRYPNTTAFRQMAENVEFQDFLVHKRAGLEDNFVLACERLDLPYIPPMEDPPFPANDTNPETAMININDYREFANYQVGDVDADNNRTGREAYDLYSDNAATIVFDNYGVRNIATLNVKAVVSGDLGYETIRINWFPSHEAWRAVIADPTRRSFTHHRYAGIEDHSKSFKVMPITMNKLYKPPSTDEETCYVCGAPGSTMRNQAASVDLPMGDQGSILCSELQFAAIAGLVPAEQCQTLSSLAQEPCGCTAADGGDGDGGGNDAPAPTTTTPATNPVCNVCPVGSSIQSPDTIVNLPTGDTGTCGQLELASANGMIPTENCGMIASLVAANCECG